MQLSDIRFLFAFDRWATTKILDATEGIDPARYAALSGRPLDTQRIASLVGHGFVETTPDGRLRVTRSGFPVLDAVVADLAA